jgi:molybdate transport system substrate-binding protein
MTSSETFKLIGISSMATRLLLAELCHAHAQKTGLETEMTSVGGVDAAKRVAAGESFDLVVLASDAIDRLMTEGHLRGGSRVDLVRSGVSVAVPQGALKPDLSNADAIAQAVRTASSVAVSTGPSGVALKALFRCWGLEPLLQNKLIVPPPGVPVGNLIASGEVALGFQQTSELIHVDGIDLVGPLPPDCDIVTVFSGAIAQTAAHPSEAASLLAFLASEATASAKYRQGMTPA